LQAYHTAAVYRRTTGWIDNALALGLSPWIGTTQQLGKKLWSIRCQSKAKISPEAAISYVSELLVKLYGSKLAWLEIASLYSTRETDEPASSQAA